MRTQSTPISIVILAAGAGTRMRSATPKVLHPICGREMLFYVIQEAQTLSNDITIVLYHQADTIRKRMEASFNGLKFILQDHKQYPGTGGALMHVSCQHEKILILNGDMPLIQAGSLKELTTIQAHIAIGVFTLANPTGYGRVIIKNEQVQRIVEEKDADAAIRNLNIVNAGIYLVTRQILTTYLPKLTNENQQQEYYLTDLIELAHLDSRDIIPFHVSEHECQGINSKNDLAHAEATMNTRIKEKWMRAGISMRLPDTIYIEDTVTFSGECVIENGVSLLGKSVIENSTIKAHSIVQDSRIIDSHVGPLAHIRPKSTLTQTHVGNFVEIKQSHLNGVKAGHLSYLGNAHIDKGTNIGAGTITCNYDGVHKHATYIGKNVFVGSGTQLIAPVTIEDQVIVAAGTTVTRNIPSGALAISRIKQLNKLGFFQKWSQKNTKDT
jgi:bifunctional UDP-N-acetylglucosamine pyrophosphorylase / glucosamine-1-phosphate N-acetyltransferase